VAEESWSRLRDGTEVEDKNGVVWRVRFSPDRKRVQLKGVTVNQETVIDTPPGRVKLHTLPEIPGVDETELAKHVVKSIVGGVVVADTVDGKNFCPATWEHPGALLAHLYVLHGLDVSEVPQELPALLALHEKDHEERRGGSRFQPHEHDDARFIG